MVQLCSWVFENLRGVGRVLSEVLTEALKQSACRSQGRRLRDCEGLALPGRAVYRHTPAGARLSFLRSE